MHTRTVAVATTREKLVLSAVLALAFACRLDKLLETPRPPGLGVAPSRVAESADSGSGEVRTVALTVSSSPSRVISWTARREADSAWLVLTNARGSTPDTLRFTLDAGDRPPGTYRDAVIVAPDDSTAPSVRVPVELRIDRVGPTTGALSVRVSTTGATPDPNGYSVTVDGGQSRSLATNDTTVYTGLAAGSYAVQLGDIAGNCTVSGGASRTVPVIAGDTATVALAVNCPTPPPQTGNLTVTAATSGGTPDPNGYTVTVDGGQSQSIGINGTVNYAGLTVGTYTVQLNDVATNCTVSGGASRSVTVTAGQTATATFTVTCPTATGDLTVSASTTGATPDPNGYSVTIDGGQSRSITNNGSTTYSLAPGSYTVQIGDVASNCTVTGGTSRTVTVSSSQQTTVTFTVTCPTPPPVTGDLTVGASTSGGTPDPNGYSVTVDGGQSRTITINGSTTYTLAAASYTVQLGDVASNCTVTGGTSRTVTVAAGQTATETFAVSCPTPPPPTGDLTVGASTGGGLPDPDGYTITVDGGQARAIATNGATTYAGIATGAHTVELIGLASNCTVSGANPRSVNVPAGSNASTTFAVDCPAPPPPPATHLEFSQQPPSAIVLSTTFSVSVTALNDQGGVATGFTGTVQLTLQGPVQVGGLTGTTTVNAVGGIARFTNLRVTGVCVGCSLVASASGLTGATSSSFNVILGQ